MAPVRDPSSQRAIFALSAPTHLILVPFVALPYSAIEAIVSGE